MNLITSEISLKDKKRKDTIIDAKFSVRFRYVPAGT